MFRFFVEDKEKDFFLLSPKILNHLKVVRIKKNESFICVYQKQFYVCHLENKLAKIDYLLDENHEFKKPVVLGVGVIASKQMEWLIQKACELGVTDFYPLISENLSKKIENLNHKIERWNQISLHAAEQSFRNQKMIVHYPITFAEILKLKMEHKFLAHEQAKNVGDYFLPTNSLILVGPEGGFSNVELELAKNANFKIINFGPRILRSETAGLFLLSRLRD